MSGGYTDRQLEAIETLQAAIVQFTSDFGIADEGQFLGDWYLVGEVQDVNPGAEGETIYFRSTSGGNLPTHRCLGLLKYAMNRED